MQMLRQDRVFNRAKEGGMNPHPEQREQHQRDRDRVDKNLLESHNEAGCANSHDADFGRLDHPDNPRLVAHIGQLPGDRRK